MLKLALIISAIFCCFLFLFTKWAGAGFNVYTDASVMVKQNISSRRSASTYSATSSLMSFSVFSVFSSGLRFFSS